MRKLKIFACVFVLLLSACGAREMPEAATAEQTHKDTAAVTPDSGNAWMDAYTEVILDAGADTPRLITLADVTGDGIPELFFADLGTVNIWITRGYSYENGKVKDVLLPDDWMPPALEMYRNTENGEMIWIASQTARNGAAEYIHTWYKCDFSDLAAVKQTFLFGWIERAEDSGTWEYLLYGSDGTGSYEDAVKQSFEDVQSRQEAFFSAYELLETNTVYAMLSDFIIGYDGTDEKLSRENLDEQALMSYFANWQAQTGSAPENRVPYTR